MIHCWKDYMEWITETYGWGSPEWTEDMVENLSAFCMLEDGHTGEHEWTSDGEIMIQFPNGSSQICSSETNTNVSETNPTEE